MKKYRIWMNIKILNEEFEDHDELWDYAEITLDEYKRILDALN
jgi:hypothetical protein